MTAVAEASEEPEASEELRAELRNEASTMALYVAICLLAALSAVAEHAAAEQIDAFKIVWGTTVGLALAHWFAFRVSARLVASGAVRPLDAKIAGAQPAGAVVVAVLATLPILVFSASAEFDVVRLVLAGFIALVGFAVASGAGGRCAGRWSMRARSSPSPPSWRLSRTCSTSTATAC
jgi:hypothetical protein